MLYCIATAVSLIKIIFAANPSENPSDNPSAKCIDDWKFWNQNCYKYFIIHAGSVTWDSAEANCTDMGANLASIHSPAEEKFIWGSVIAQPNCTRDCAWIGLNMDEPENVGCNWEINRCRWSDGSLFDFANWMPNEPNGPGREHCTMIDNRYSGKWNDVVCTGLQRTGGWICKMPSMQPESARPESARPESARPESDFSFTAAIVIPMVVVAGSMLILAALLIHSKRIRFTNIGKLRLFVWFKSNRAEDSLDLLPNIIDVE